MEFEDAFKPGQKVRNIFGIVQTVVRQQDCQVFVEEGSPSGWYHPSKLFPIN